MNIIVHHVLPLQPLIRVIISLRGTKHRCRIFPRRGRKSIHSHRHEKYEGKYDCRHSLNLIFNCFSHMHISFLSFDFLIFIKEVFYCCFNLKKEYTLFGHSSVTVAGFSYKIF